MVLSVGVIAEADKRDLTAAGHIHALAQKAYSLEAKLIGCAHFPPLSESVENFRRSMDTFLVFWRSGKIVGAVSFAKAADGHLITRLVVAPEHLRKGIGTALIKALERRLPAAGLLRVSTAEKNAPGIAFYYRIGFKKTGASISKEGIALIHLTKLMEV